MRYVLVCESSVPIDVAGWNACSVQPFDLSTELARHSFVVALTPEEATEVMTTITVVFMAAWFTRFIVNFFLNRRD